MCDSVALRRETCTLCLLSLEVEFLEKLVRIIDDVISLFWAGILDAAAAQASTSADEQLKANRVPIQIYGKVEGLTVWMIKLNFF